MVFFFSEGFAFVNFCKIYDCDIVIESGLRFGGSTRMFLNFLNNNIIIHTNDLNQQFPEDIKNTVNSIKNEYNDRNWNFYPGDGEKIVIDLIKKYENTDKKIGILLDGPKYSLALKIQDECLKFKNVKFVAIHDMGEGPYNLPKNIGKKNIFKPINKLRENNNFIFSTDSLWYRNEYANRVDNEIHKNSMTKVWKKFKKKYPIGCGLVFCQNPNNNIKFTKEKKNLYYK